MEVAASLPNILKVFPLKVIMAREGFSSSPRETFSSGHQEAAAACYADEEMEEGEIDTREAMFSPTIGENAALPLLPQHPCCADLPPNLTCIEESTMFATSADCSLPRLSSMTDDVQLEQSVDALLSLPDKLSSQGASKFCDDNQLPQFSFSSQSGRVHCQASSPVKKPGSGSLILKLSLKTLPVSCQKACSSPPKLSQSPAAKEAASLNQIHLLPSPSKISCIESKDSSQPDPLAVLSPSNSLKCTSPSQAACMEVSTQLKQQGQAMLVAGEPSKQTLSSQMSHHQPSSNLLVAPSSAPDSQPLVPSGLNGAQTSAHGGSFAVNRSIHERTYITCVGGKRRARSSAVRDYPEGCGRVFSATANQVSVDQQPFCYSSHGNTLKVPAVSNRALSGPSFGLKSEQGRRRKEDLFGPVERKKEVGDVSPDLKPSVIREKDESALRLHKLQKAYVLPCDRELSQKSENQSSKDCSLGMTKKKAKVRPLSSIVGMDGLPLSYEERSSQNQWFLKDDLYGYDGLTCKVRPVQLHGNLPGLHNGLTSKVRLVQPHGKPGLPKPLGMISEGLHNSFAYATICGGSPRFQVKRTLQEFDCVRRSLAMLKDRHQRPDLAAAKILKNKGRWRNCGGEKIVGDVPGVEIGDQFSFRIEMLLIGLHRQVQGGIDYIAGTVRPKGPLATSIVASGGYEDDDDFGATFIYTGQGGNNYKGDRRQGRDQELKRGNLALSNSYKEKSPVRVIRGSTDDKFYTYDGLYDVIDCWFQTGIAGFGVFQFKLSRRPGQPELVSSIVRFMGTLKKKGLVRPHLLLADISCGKERLPVSVVNEVDEATSPQNFTYVSKMKYPSWYRSELSGGGCDCVGGCVDASKCLCAVKNGGEFPYNEVGQIVMGKKVVFECGKSCACPSSCYNRVSQKGLKRQLEVFKTKNRGWGVRSLEPIRPGDFICEYAGELLSDADAEQRTGCDEYLFDIGHRTNASMDVSDLMDLDKGEAIVPVTEDTGFTIDARSFGSVARFINHSCSPNLYPQDVVYDSDLRFPHVVLFAMENIPPMRELSYDYNYSVGDVRDANGNVKCKSCYCGAQYCRGRLY